MRLADCKTVSDLYQFTKKMEPEIGSFGGRKFRVEEESVCYNDIVRKLGLLAPKPTKETEKLVRKLRKRDKEADKLLDGQDIFVRLLTYARQYFGNWTFNRGIILSKLEKAPAHNRCMHNLAEAQKQQKEEQPKKFDLSDEKDPTEWRKNPIKGTSAEYQGVKTGSASCKGKPKTMEDRTLVTELPEFNAVLAGVFDGHGGDLVAKFIKKNLAETLAEQLRKFPRDDEGTYRALKETFIQLDQRCSGDQGSTAIVTLILDGKIWTACVGDSRAILSTSEGAQQLSEDAKPTVQRYADKIKKLGGDVLNGRVGSPFGPSVARAIGDHGVTADDNTPLISANPKITCIPLDEAKGGILILTSDGLTDKASTEEISLKAQEMKSAGHSPELMARRLVYSALHKRSSDNVSVVVGVLPNSL